MGSVSLSLSKECKLPKKEWWCGCFPVIRFESEKQFLDHMRRKHNLWYVNDLPKFTLTRKS